MQKLILISLLVYIINIPFGYWRANVRRYSWKWILSIHVPVLIVILLRIFSHLGFAWFTYVFMVSAFFLGQQSGVFLNKRFIRADKNVSSCLFCDLIKNFRQ